MQSEIVSDSPLYFENILIWLVDIYRNSTLIGSWSIYNDLIGWIAVDE